MNDAVARHVLTSTHWGTYRLELNGGRIAAVRPFPGDPDPSPIAASLRDAVDHPARVREPMIRKGWLESGPGPADGGRGSDPLVAVPWDEALERVAAELDRVKSGYGNEAIYGGSYGWASAGRFHHGQSQIHRFLNHFGGYSYSVNSYSLGAGHVIVPHIFGCTMAEIMATATSWEVLAEHAGLVVMFGGVPLKNAQINQGGISRHATGAGLRACRDNGVEFVNIAPTQDDAAGVNAQWIAPRPNTDVALMLGLAHTLLTEERHDQAFLDRYCVGFERMRAYLLGSEDGRPKDADWAGAICALDAQAIRRLARRMADARTFITVAWSLQRADHGEQSFWMAATLAAMLGQIGLPGGGVGYGYGAIDGIGNSVKRVGGLSLPQGRNPVETFIPVARIADMLLHPGEVFDYNGRELTYPDIKLVYWCGGNPFHHHQDLNRLTRAWQRPDTIVVHEPWWTATARHADIVLPATTSLERNDIGRTAADPVMVAMQRAVAPLAGARDDYAIFGALAGRLGFEPAFTEGRDEMDWLRHLYAVFRQQVARDGLELPDFDVFWSEGSVELPLAGTQRILFDAFRNDPDGHPLGTPSGRIEIHSRTIDGFDYADCPGHPSWMPPVEWLGADTAGEYPLHLISHQPATRLHSQLDCGEYSVRNKISGREAMTMHPEDAASRGIRDGDVVRVHNARGECLAGVTLSTAVRPRVVVLPTGAWYDPEQPGGLDRHGNPNVLTLDKGTSRLAQGTIAHSALVEVERFRGEAPPVEAHTPPQPIHRAGDPAPGERADG